VVELAASHPNLSDSAITWINEVTDRAVSALAQPEPVAPTDEEILRCAQKHSVAYTCVDGKVIYGLAEGHDMRDDVLTFARAVLARWGTPANNTGGTHFDV
jgi:hypothetical protein